MKINYRRWEGPRAPGGNPPGVLFFKKAKKNFSKIKEKILIFSVFPMVGVFFAYRPNLALLEVKKHFQCFEADPPAFLIRIRGLFHAKVYALVPNPNNLVEAGIYPNFPLSSSISFCRDSSHYLQMELIHENFSSAIPLWRRSHLNYLVFLFRHLISERTAEANSLRRWFFLFLLSA